MSTIDETTAGPDTHGDPYGHARRQAWWKRRSQTALSTSTGPQRFWTSCEECDLTGGPYGDEEAAHFSALHDSLLHRGRATSVVVTRGWRRTLGG
jgi:hypothetical protein